jgi:acyl dehydratase
MTAELTVGAELGPIERGPITTRQLVEYAGASLDFNRIHYDEPFARAGGHPSVIVHGMLSMAFLGQLAVAVAGARWRVAELTARFKAVAYPGDVVRATGKVTAVDSDGVTLALTATRGDTVLLEGTARLAARGTAP